MSPTRGSHAVVCDRAREASSLRIDGELSEVETAMLERHLGICGACADFDAGVRTTTATIRSAAVERPSRTFTVPRRERARLSAGRRLALVAAAVVAATIAGTLVEEPRPPAPPAPPDIALTPYRSDEGQRQDRRGDLEESPVAPRPRVDRV
ncbi:MAG TPA: zf-HC2 domain-containing protein [Gaiellaceae bacterium]|nr:zf-HC2 domain-containing protein [Gaiellaceae bacterium]